MHHHKRRFPCIIKQVCRLVQYNLAQQIDELYPVSLLKRSSTAVNLHHIPVLFQLYFRLSKKNK